MITFLIWESVMFSAAIRRYLYVSPGALLTVPADSSVISCTVIFTFSAAFSTCIVISVRAVFSGGAAVTVKEKVVLWVFPPPSPVIVIVYAPAGIAKAVEIVSVEVKPGVPDDWAKVAVAPDGRPDAVRLTVLLKSLTEVSETVVLADTPWFTDPDVGLTLIVKSGSGGGAEVINVKSSDTPSFPAASLDFTLQW
jgi:hypothetical protein